MAICINDKNAQYFIKITKYAISEIKILILNIYNYKVCMSSFRLMQVSSDIWYYVYLNII